MEYRRLHSPVGQTGSLAIGVTVLARRALRNVSGTQWNDTLIGGTGTETLNGNSGNDTFIAGTGSETLVGDNSSGNDTYVYAQGDGNDTIWNYVGTNTLILGERA